MLRARQYVSIHNSNLCLTFQGQSILTESFDSITKALYLGTQHAYSGNPNKSHCIFSYGLWDLQPFKANYPRRHTQPKWQQPQIQVWQQNENRSNYCNEQARFFVELREYNPQLIGDLHKNKDTTPSKEERVRRINATALDVIKAYTPIGWSWSGVQVSQRQQTQTPARQTVSTRRTRHTIQRQTECMDMDPGCSNTQPNNPSRQTRTKNNPTSRPNKGRRGILST